jgi:pyruvate dehydrogenase E1 component
LDTAWQSGVLAGGYWHVAPAAAQPVALVAMGAILPEALKAHRMLAEDLPGLGLLQVTSPDLLHRDWRMRGADSHVVRLLAALPADAGLVTLCDAAPATLSWLGGMRGQRVQALGVDRFGQTGTLPDLYRAYGLDADAIVDAAARLLHHAA